MIELKFIASIAERDIDLLLMEEFTVSDEFREWFSSRVFGEPVYNSYIGAWHSVCDTNLGESDLVFLFAAIDGPRTAILIENKIDAPPQPDQGNRYRLRGEKGLKEGYWESFKTCVIAPCKYLSSTNHAKQYDIEISYEEILSFFQSRRPRDERFSYKARIILEGIEQNRRGYQPKYSEEMTNFVNEYYEYAKENFKCLGMQESKPRPSGSTWIMFYPNLSSKEMDLVHQIVEGVVKVYFKGKADRFDEINEKYMHLLQDDMTIGVAGKSVTISIKVPKLEPLSKAFFEEKEKVELALNCLSRLKGIVTNNNNI